MKVTHLIQNWRFSATANNDPLIQKVKYTKRRRRRRRPKNTRRDLAIRLLLLVKSLPHVERSAIMYEYFISEGSLWKQNAQKSHFFHPSFHFFNAQKLWLFFPRGYMHLVWFFVVVLCFPKPDQTKRECDIIYLCFMVDWASTRSNIAGMSKVKIAHGIHSMSTTPFFSMLEYVRMRNNKFTLHLWVCCMLFANGLMMAFFIFSTMPYGSTQATVSTRWDADNTFYKHHHASTHNMV